MPNLKISQLTGGGAAQAADEFVVARSGGNNKITGANVAAAATSVGTLTSLTVGGNLTVNTNTLFVNSASNRVGIGTITPNSPLEVAALSQAVNTGNAHLNIASTDTAAADLGGVLVFSANTTPAAKFPVASISGRHQTLGAGNYSGYLQFATTSAGGGVAERMRIDASGNVGLGVTPSAWDSANFRAIQIGAGGTSYFSLTAQTTNQARGSLLWNAYGTGNETFAYVTTGDNATRFSQQYDFRWFTASSGTAGSAITFTERLRLDSSGNLGLGITPSAWESTCRMLQLGANCTVGRANSGETQLGFNYFINSSGQYTYIQSLTALRYEQIGGQHRWYNAPSGTAGNAITFTQAMTLDASGNLGVGTASPLQKLHVVGASAVIQDTNAAITLWKDGTPTRAGRLIFNSATTDAVEIGLYNGTSWSSPVVVKPAGQMRFTPLAAAPTVSVQDGDVYYDSTTNKLRVRAGGAWVDLH